MAQQDDREIRELFELETRDWLESLDYLVAELGPDRTRNLLRRLLSRAVQRGVQADFPGSTPYVNTIPADETPPYPGNREIERRLKSLVRWNAMAMVVRANRRSGVGGHISTFASAATLIEVAQNHILKGKEHPAGGDMVYFQGHASPGIYARAYLEGRLEEHHLENFRRELADGGGLASYPHPRLMPDFWEFPTVSMGLSPLMAIYQARFNRYLEDRGIAGTGGRQVWAFLGDGEMDEPESMGAITLASREKLDNLTFVVNCNLQRLDGPVRGNGRVIQELEAAFRGAGWEVIKVVLGSEWDALLAADRENLIINRFGEIVDGHTQKYLVESGAFIREEFFGTDERLKALVAHMSDEEIRKMSRGGHDPVKVYAAYRRALARTGRPTVILAHTVKGYGLGEAGEGRNVTHQQKKLNEEELRTFRTRFAIPLSDADVKEAPFYRPPEDSEELKYLRRRREELGGFVPERRPADDPLPTPPEMLFKGFHQGSGTREVANTMAFVQLLAKLLDDEGIGRRIVPIVPDEARTFGMESLFRKVGIYSHTGQLYEPVDSDSLLYYNEQKDGQILEEGITEAGSMASFIAAGTSYATHGRAMIPFYIYYSMFGFQRIGDLVWAATDMQCRGFLLGGTAGRTTLEGEGLQHQDGHSQHLALAYNTVKAYDPAYAFEVAVIVREGLYRMFERQENWIYYLTLENETYPMPAMPRREGVREGILKGLYKFEASESRAQKKKVHLLGSGAILNEARRAREILEEEFHIPADVWSVTSWKELYLDCVDTDRHNRMHPDQEPRRSWLERLLEKEEGVYVAVGDYLRTLPLSVAKWMPWPLEVLGTDGFGRSETRESLRDFFEVDAGHIAYTAIVGLAREGRIKREEPARAARILGIEPDRPNPMFR